MGLEMMSSSH